MKWFIRLAEGVDKVEIFDALDEHGNGNVRFCGTAKTALEHLATTMQAIDKMTAERDALLALLAELTDPDPCSYDHHGLCQAHSLGEKPCPHARARALLAEKGVQVWLSLPKANG